VPAGPVEAWFDREEECAILDELVGGIRTGRSASLVMRGEAGIGKTRLLDYAADRAGDLRVERITGVESEMELAFAGIHQLVAPVVDHLDRLPGPQRLALETSFGLVSGGAPDRFFVGLATLTLLSEVARAEPLLCLIDDAQWLDQVSAEILAFVARRLDADPVGIVFAVREPDAGRNVLDGLPELVLTGLAPDDARQLLRSVTRGPVPRPVSERLVTDSGGNPLALLELGTDLNERDLADRLVHGTEPVVQPWPIGRRLEERFLQRARLLPSDSQTFLLLVAAEPTGDPRLLWSAATEMGIDAQVAAAPAEAARLLVVGSRVAFAHPLMRSAVYHAAGAADRRAAHRALGAVTDPDLDADRRAWHRSLAVLAPDEDVALELERAARQAKARGGFAATAALLERAAELTEDSGVRAARLLSAAEAALLAGAPDRSATLVDAARPLAADERQRARAERLRGSIRFALGEMDETPAILLRAALTFPPRDLRRAHDAMFESWFTAMYAGPRQQWPGVRDVATAALELPPIPDAERTIGDRLLTAIAVRETGGDAVDLLRDAVTALTSEHPTKTELLPFPAGWMAAGELWDYDAQYAVARRWVEATQDVGALPMLVTALHALALSQVVCGELSAAEASAGEATEISAAIGTWTMPPAAVGLPVLVGQGQYEQAMATGAAVIEEANQHGLKSVVRTTRWMLTLGHVAAGRYKEALATAQRTAEGDMLMYGNIMLPEIVEAGVRVGERDVALAALARLTDLATRCATPAAMGLLARSRALLAGPEDSADLFEVAIDQIAMSRSRWELGRTHLLYGEWLRRQKRRRDARQHLRTAADLFEAMGAEGFATRAALELGATGERARRRTAETRFDLTWQEERTAHLAAEGQTNHEIAARLFISPSTVDYHLKKVYAKLGVTNRTRLSRALAGRGADPDTASAHGASGTATPGR